MKAHHNALLLALALVAALAILGPQSRFPAPGWSSVPGSGAGQGARQGAAPSTGRGGAEVAGARLNALPELTSRATRDLLEAVVPPPRDEADLVRRFRLTCGTPSAVPVPLSRTGSEGETRTFWVLDEPNRRFMQVDATLRLTTEHLLFYVQEASSLPGVSPEALAASATVFEQKTFPLLRRYFGDLPEPPRITIFVGRVPGVGGYFSASDMLPRDVNPYSNERPMVFMSLDATRPGTAGFDGVLAHEVQHFVHYVVHPQQDSWINEGASELAMAVAGYDQIGAARAFLNRPETQLNKWADRPSESYPHYGAGYLILEYFAQRAGGYEQVKALIASPGSSVRTFDSYFALQRSPLRFDDLFRDFVLANVLNDRSIADGRFGYDRLSLRAHIQESYAGFPALSNAAVRPYATRYVELLPGAQRGDLELRFSAAADARLFDGTAHSGSAQWWGNAADDMETTLTRELDLTAVDRATLRFNTWFSIERDYDYGGVAVSTDGGCTWRTLPGRHTTDTNPVGQNLGHGFTGRSGGAVASWVEEEMDLSPYAGQKVLVRFFNVTDQSYHAAGFVVDDIAVPEIGFADDAESDLGWESHGFVRSVNAAALEWAVQVVAFTESGPQISRLQTVRSGDLAQGTLVVPRFGEQVRRVVVAVSPLVPATLEPAEYRLEAVIR